MSKYKKLLFVSLFSVFCILSTNLFAQVDTAWVRRYNGPGNSSDYAYAIAVDPSGNVYVTGYSYGSGTDRDYATIKYVQTGAIEEEASGKMQEARIIQIFPNPASSYCVVCGLSSVNRAEVKIFDVTGKVIKEERFKSSKDSKMSLEGIKSGVYFVKVNDEMVKEKLVVTK